MPSDQNTFIIVGRLYDKNGTPFATRIVGDHICRIPYVSGLIEEQLKQLGWVRFEEKSSVKHLKSGITVRYSIFLGLYFLTGVTTPFENSLIEKRRERRHLS